MDSIEARLSDTKLAAAIDNACKSLPSDCQVHLVMEQFAANVILEVDGEELDFASNRETLADTINDAVEAAQDLNG